ncbi:MAG: DUF2914 domain-containing protein [Calditrichota bacterium]
MKLAVLQTPVNAVQHFYQRYSRFLPVVSFIGGFLWDSLTLTRIDRLSDNLFLLGYLFLLGFSIILVNLVENSRLAKLLFLKYREWYPLAIQFFLGGLFSSYVVFYFQSAAITKNWLFLGILIVMLFANEFLEKRLTNIYLQVTLYFLVVFSFCIFFVPVLIGRMSVYVFILSGLLSLMLIGAFVYLLFKKLSLLARPELIRVSSIIIALYLLLNLFYFLNWIPPVPLSLKYSGIYHQVQRTGDDYLLKFEQPAWYQFWKKSDDPFHYTDGDTVFCFAAVFAPTDLKTKIFHEWQQYLPGRDRWLTTDHLGYPLTGGRKPGYRGYTYKRNVQPGEWRVEVKTGEGQVLGRIDFEIVAVDSAGKPLKTIFY